MADTVQVPIPLTPEAAARLRTDEERERLGAVISAWLGPTDGRVDALRSLIAEIKLEALRDGLTDAEVDAELEAYDGERRL